jgi:DNA end-binding protein Ku
LLSFGLVSIPVELYVAQRKSSPGLRLLDAEGTPLSRKYYCPKDGREVSPDHLVRGHELEDGSVVALTDEELEAVDPKKSREIDLRLFVDRDSIDPIFFERGYFLVPGRDSGKPYGLLSAVMERTRRAGIASFVMRDKEHLIAIFSEQGLLVGETLRFHHQVRSVADVELSKPKRPSPALVKKLERAVAELDSPKLPTAELTDSYGEALRQLAEKKYRLSESIVTSRAAPPPRGADVIDLMQVIKRSLAANGLLPAGGSSAPAAKKKKKSPRRAGPQATRRRRPS